MAPSISNNLRPYTIELPADVLPARPEETAWREHIAWSSLPGSSRSSTRAPLLPSRDRTPPGLPVLTRTPEVLLMSVIHCVITSPRTELRGVVRRADPNAEPHDADLNFSADYTVTSTDDKGGRVLTHIEVILCYWGRFWSTTPAPSPSSDEYTAAIEGIVTGPFMDDLNQYRGVGHGTLDPHGNQRQHGSHGPI